jgi:hypothetical protein
MRNMLGGCKGQPVVMVKFQAIICINVSVNECYFHPARFRAAVLKKRPWTDVYTSGSGLLKFPLKIRLLRGAILSDRAATKSIAMDETKSTP